MKVYPHLQKYLKMIDSDLTEEQKSAIETDTTKNKQRGMDTRSAMIEAINYLITEQEGERERAVSVIQEHLHKVG